MRNQFKLICTLCFSIILLLSANGSFGASSKQLDLYVGETLELKPYLISEGILKSGTPNWQSLNPNIASVSTNGIVTGLKPGTTVISATISEASGIKSASVTINVKSMVKTVAFTEEKLKLAVGQNHLLKAEIKAIDGFASPKNAGLTFKSQIEQIVKIDSSGMLTGISPGKALVYVSTNDGDKRAYCEIEVVSMVKAVKAEPDRLELKLGETFQLKTVIEPNEAIFKGVTYTSNNPAVATVDANGYVTTKSVGIAAIKIVSLDGQREAYVPVTVISMLKGVDLDQTYLELDGTRKTVQLRATVKSLKENEKPLVDGVKWSSSNANVVAVSESGLLTAKAPGLVTITATTLDGGFQAYCSVKSSVLPETKLEIPMTALKWIDPPKVVYTGQEVILDYKKTPENTTETTVTARGDLATSNVSLSSNGKFIFKPSAEGFYHITLSNSSGLTDTFEVQVKSALSSLKIVPDALEAVNSGYIMYLGQETKLHLNYSLMGITSEQFTNKTIVWNYNNNDLKVTVDPNNAELVSIKLLRPVNTYIEVSLLAGTQKNRINLFYESSAQEMKLADQATINLNYIFKPPVTLVPKPNLKYGIKEVANLDVDLYLEEAYIPTEFLLNEVAFEEGNLKSLKEKADALSGTSEGTATLSLWGKHFNRQYMMKELIVDQKQEYQLVKNIGQLTDRELKPLNFFVIKEGGISSAFNGRALVRVVSKDGNLTKKIWITVKEQSDDLILMDSSGKVIAVSDFSSSVEAQEKALKEAAEKARIAGLRARLPKLSDADMPSVGQLENVVKVYEKGVLSQGLMKKMTANVTRIEAAELLVKAYEKLTGKVVKKIPQNYYVDTTSEFANKAYSLGLMGSLPKDRKFKQSGTITTAELSQMLVKLSSISKGKVDAKLVATISNWGKTSKGIVTKEQMVEWLAKMLP